MISTRQPATAPAAVWRGEQVVCARGDLSASSEEPWGRSCRMEGEIGVQVWLLCSQRTVGVGTGAAPGLARPGQALLASWAAKPQSASGKQAG